MIDPRPVHRPSAPGGNGESGPVESGRPVEVTAPYSRGIQVGGGNQQVNVAGDYLAGAGPAAVEWPVLVGRPPRQADAFQDRPGLRAMIWSGLATDQVTVLTQVVAGDGGTGKTQLAAAAYRAALAPGDEEAGIEVPG